MTKTLSTLWILIPALFFLAALPTYAAGAEDIKPGDLIRGETHSAVYYYGEDGFRYVFPNDKTYFTWYDNFDDVVWLTDGDLATIQIGGNTTYKPGVRMIKITTDPTVYVVSSQGELRAILSEEVAEELYGPTWNTMIDDVPDEIFSNYSLGSELEFASQFNPESEEAGAYSIGSDKKLQIAVEVIITEEGYDSATITIEPGRAVRWINNGTENHSATEWDRAWGSGTLEPGEHFTHYFTETGTWHYYSTYDNQENMTGAIIVE